MYINTHMYRTIYIGLYICVALKRPTYVYIGLCMTKYAYVHIYRPTYM